VLPRTVLVVLLFASPAFAFDTTKLGQLGSIALDMDELRTVIAQSPTLKREIDEAVAKLNKKPDEIMCDGMRFPGSWTGLSGLRASPYRCQIGDQWLKIRTKVRVTGKGGKVYEQITSDAMRSAKNVSETHPTWTWSDKEPTQP